MVKAGSYPLKASLDPNVPNMPYSKAPYEIGTAVAFLSDSEITSPERPEGDRRGLPRIECALFGTAPDPAPGAAVEGTSPRPSTPAVRRPRYFALSARHTRGAVIGSSRTRAPIAAATALAMAPVPAMTAASAMPFAPNGPTADGTSM